MSFPGGKDFRRGSVCHVGERCHCVVDQDFSVVNDDGVIQVDCTVGSSVDNELITVDHDIGIKAGGKAIEWFVARAFEELRCRHAGFETIGDDDYVGADFLFDSANQDVVRFAAGPHYQKEQRECEHQCCRSLHNTPPSTMTNEDRSTMIFRSAIQSGHQSARN